METKWGGGDEKGELGTGGNGGKTETEAPGHLEPEHSKAVLLCSSDFFHRDPVFTRLQQQSSMSDWNENSC